jgi:SAM-dependent methyltransferase
MSDPGSPYDAIARLYDPWSRSVVEDMEFYVAEARAATQGGAGPIVELGVGTGRIALPIASAGIAVIGVDSSEGMIGVCRAQAERAGLTELLDLRLGDLREPPVEERVGLVICPFRAFLHMPTEAERLRALLAAYGLLQPGGRFVFDVFTPSRGDIEETHGRWIEREPGIYERAHWDEQERTLTLGVRGPDDETTLVLAWISPAEWHALIERAGFTVEQCYGWFDRRPYAGGEDSIWVARRPRS